MTLLSKVILISLIWCAWCQQGISLYVYQLDLMTVCSLACQLRNVDCHNNCVTATSLPVQQKLQIIECMGPCYSHPYVDVCITDCFGSVLVIPSEQHTLYYSMPNTFIAPPPTAIPLPTAQYNTPKIMASGATSVILKACKAAIPLFLFLTHFILNIS